MAKSTRGKWPESNMIQAYGWISIQSKMTLSLSKSFSISPYHVYFNAKITKIVNKQLNKAPAPLISSGKSMFIKAAYLRARESYKWGAELQLSLLVDLCVRCAREICARASGRVSVVGLRSRPLQPEPVIPQANDSEANKVGCGATRLLWHSKM